jgi:hypothetical protein
LVIEISLHYDTRSKKHKKMLCCFTPTITSQCDTTMSLNVSFIFNTKTREIISRSCFQEVSTGHVVLHKTIQAMYITYNVPLRRFSVTVFLPDKTITIKYTECVCRLRFVACNVHGPYCLLWTDRIDNIFAHLVKGTIFEEKILNIKSLFWFSLQLLSETLLVRRRNKWDMIKNVHWSSCTIPSILIRF